MELIKFFKYDLLITLAALAFAFYYGGPAVLTTTAILIVLEIVFSFDNAGVNAKYLAKMSHFWRRMFLTVGILIAVFGMRLVFPFAIVSIAGNISPVEAWHLAMAQGDPHIPGTYGYILHQAHGVIAAFGGMFLLMLFLSFVFDSEKDTHWLSWIEKPLTKAGHFDSMPALVSGIALLLIDHFMVAPEKQGGILFAGIAGILTFLATNGLATFMEDKQEAKEDSLGQVALLTGQAAFSMFLFLEVLDASFSFDGVLGAFAIVTDPVVIAIGLGVGALFVRSMTIYLVEKGTLQEFIYMEHGAHWAIGVLATMLLLTIKFEIPDVLIGLTGMVFIIASIIHSKKIKGIEDEAGTGIDSEHTGGLYTNKNAELNAEFEDNN